MAICMSYAHMPGAIDEADRLLAEIVPAGGAVAAAWCYYAAGECRVTDDPIAARDLLEPGRRRGAGRRKRVRRGGRRRLAGIARCSARRRPGRDRDLPLVAAAVAAGRCAVAVLDGDAVGRRGC